jgi:hypothetical protein
MWRESATKAADDPPDGGYFCFWPGAMEILAPRLSLPATDAVKPAAADQALRIRITWRKTPMSKPLIIDLRDPRRHDSIMACREKRTPPVVDAVDLARWKLELKHKRLPQLGLPIFEGYRPQGWRRISRELLPDPGMAAKLPGLYESC